MHMDKIFKEGVGIYIFNTLLPAGNILETKNDFTKIKGEMHSL